MKRSNGWQKLGRNVLLIFTIAISLTGCTAPSGQELLVPDRIIDDDFEERYTSGWMVYPPSRDSAWTGNQAYLFRLGVEKGIGGRQDSALFYRDVIEFSGVEQFGMMKWFSARTDEQSELQFELWYDFARQPRSFRVLLHDEEGEKYSFYPAVVKNEWKHYSIPLAEFTSARGSSLKSGVTIRALLIEAFVEAEEGERVYLALDNVLLTGARLARFEPVNPAGVGVRIKTNGGRGAGR